MTQIARLALATPRTGPYPSTVALAWVAGLTNRRWRVQHFRAQACPTGYEAVGRLSGLPGRHLDSWLMPEPVLHSLFARGAACSDLALVEGALDPSAHAGCMETHASGGLRPIAEALSLPVVAVVPCPPRSSLHLPRVPDAADAVFLDGLESPEDFDFYRRMITLTTHKPVLGALDALPEVDAALAAGLPDRGTTDDVFNRLSASFLRYADLTAIRALSKTRPYAVAACEAPTPARPPFRVAYAQDQVFGAYFPDTLEALEALGAELVEFSPRQDEAIPADVDLVMIGCGFPDLYLDELMRNQSLIESLRSHVCRGLRIYAEGGGAAYLGRSMLVHGRRVAGAGILPFDAELLAEPSPPRPVVRTLTRSSWLGPVGTEVRGYHSGRWRFVPGADPLDCPSCFGSLTAEDDVYYHHHAVGGLMHLHLGALTDVVHAFAGPHAASLSLPRLSD